MRFPLRILLGATLLWSATVTMAAAAPAVDVFVRDGCEHCADEKAFLTAWQATSPELAVTIHDLADPADHDLFNAVTAKANLPKATPVTVINGIVLQGFDTPETTGKAIHDLYEAQSQVPAVPLSQAVTAEVLPVAQGGSTCSDDPTIPCREQPLLVRIPLTSKTIDVAHYSLPVLSGILGLIDGFNPCAMWVLVTFLIVLMQIGDRKKMWQVAGLFILAETVMYYLILNVWFTTWDFIGLDRIVTPLVGVLALGGGGFFLYEGLFSDGTCKVTNLEQRHRTRARIQQIAAGPFTLLTALGIIALAFSVNIIEFACSIGIPQAFTKILEINRLDTLTRHGLMLIYIIGYMLDDFIVFGVALWGIDRLTMTHRYAKITNVIGGVLMLILGLLLLIKPELLHVW